MNTDNKRDDKGRFVKGRRESLEEKEKRRQKMRGHKVSNETRKKFICDSIINTHPKSVGVYRLTMKSNSDNFRESAVFDIIKRLQKNKIQINLYVNV